MSKNFASTGDLAEKKITFAEIGRDLYAFTAEGDPNSGVIVGDDVRRGREVQRAPFLVGATRSRERVPCVSQRHPPQLAEFVEGVHASLTQTYTGRPAINNRKP